MQKEDLLDMALEKIMGEMDDVEGHSAMEHSLEDCPDPLNCDQHGLEAGKNLTPEPSAIKIEIHKPGMPTLDGEKLSEEGEGTKSDEGLSPAEAEELRKLLK